MHSTKYEYKLLLKVNLKYQQHNLTNWISIQDNENNESKIAFVININTLRVLTWF